MTLVGLLLLSIAGTFGALLVAAGLMGVGSAIFHPESSRIARMASGGRHGFAQSFFQVGGNLGSSFGPLVGAFLVVPRGQASVAWCALLAVAAIVVLWRVGDWSRRAHARAVSGGSRRRRTRAGVAASRRLVARHPGGADLLEILLPGEPHQLLHVLPDHQVPPDDSRARRSICSCFWPPSRPAPCWAGWSAIGSA